MFKIRNAALFGLAAILSGCWSSEYQLISARHAVDPFGNAEYYQLGAPGEETVLQELANGDYVHYAPTEDGADTIKYRFERFTDFFFLGSQKKYIVAQETISKESGKTERTYMYALLTRDEAGYLRLYIGSSSRQFNSIRDIKNAFREEIKSGAISGSDFGRAVPMTRSQASAWRQRIAAKAVSEKKQKAEEVARKAKFDRIERSRQMARRQKAVSDREPTQSEMQAAINRTVAGQVFSPQITKLGACRKVAAQDYMCRYSWVGVNMGNFWKHSGIWQFRRVDY